MPDLAQEYTMNSLKAQDLFSLSGRRALVTGASRGIAAEIARTLAANGAEVCINFSARVDAATGFDGAAMALKRTIAADGGRAHLVEQDMLVPGAGRLVAEQTHDICGGCDIAVASASMQIHRSFLDMPAEDTMRQLQLNFIATVEMLQALLPGMKVQRYGRVLSIGSVQEAAPSPEMPIYAATKAAQVNLIRSLAVEMAPFGITLNNLAPGLVQAFTPAFVISNGTGAPLDSTLFYTLYLYIEGFSNFRMGYASALAWVLLAIIAVLTAIAFATARFWVYNPDD